jgi:hypothetical protein
MSVEPSETYSLGAIPEYPVHVLPAAAQQLVSYGRQVGLPANLVAGAATAAIAAGIGPLAQLEISATWPERAILWIPLIAPRGAGKSPAQDLAFRPLRDHDAALGEDDGPPILSGDQTLEALARSLSAAGGGGVIDLDELVVQLRGLGEYKRGGGDQGRFLTLWTGAPWSFTRVGSTGKRSNAVNLRIHRPTVVICGGLQTPLHELLGGEEDGLRPRWLPYMAEQPTAEANLVGQPPSSWQQLLTGDDGLVRHRGSPRAWAFSRRALDAFQHHMQIWKRQAQGAEATASTSAAVGKAATQLARLTLTFAEGDDPGSAG